MPSFGNTCGAEIDILELVQPLMDGCEETAALAGGRGTTGHHLKILLAKLDVTIIVG